MDSILRFLTAAAALTLLPAGALAQSMPGMETGTHDPPAASPAPPPPAPAAPPPMGGMAMPGMAPMTAGARAHMAGALGTYAMSRDSSGTAWQPDSSPMDGIHGRVGAWSTMIHGYATLVYDDQGGPRGDRMTFVESMLMGMAQRSLGGGTLTLRAMGSLDPLMGKSGYPLLLGTGETANGRTEQVDRQHPHDLIMELAAAYSRPLAPGLSGFVYFGLPGEPALGPTTYMHRFSGAANPEAPIGHHWLDSTHVTFGVLTGGLVVRNLKLEGSLFTGREPDQNRYGIERPRFDSWSLRATWNPVANLSMQVSHGFLHSPEQLEPDVNVRRTTASATLNLPVATGNWQTTFAWGRNASRPGRTTDAALAESVLGFGRNTIFGRVETVDKDELFADAPANPLRGQAFNVSKASLGYARTFGIASNLVLDLGGLASAYRLPPPLKASYGSRPHSLMLFARLRLGR
jgi:hypothetical protein